MFGSPIIDVLIGMIFIYSLFSILVTQMNTLISELLKLRARHLRGALEELLEDEDLRKKILTHPLIGLIKPEEGRELDNLANGVLQNVTWIKPETFTDVLFNTLRVEVDSELLEPISNVIAAMPAGETRSRLRAQIDRIVNTGLGFAELREIVNTLSESNFAPVLREAMSDIDSKIATLGLANDDILSMLAGIAEIDNDYLRQALETILVTSTTIKEAEERIGSWFNSQMDRASKAFTNTMRIYSLVIGLLIAVLLNVDSLFIARVLWDDPALRETIASTAQTADIASLEQVVADAEAEAATEETSLEDIERVLNAIEETSQQISQLRLPIGWGFQNLNQLNAQSEEGDGEDDEAALEEAVTIANSRNLWLYLNPGTENWFFRLMTKLIGLGATMIAVAQGAPFWFGLLRRFSGGSG